MRTKKNLIRSITAIILLPTLLVGMMTSCGTPQATLLTEDYYSGGKLTLSSNVFSYYLSYTKTMILSGYYAEQDYPELWAELLPEGAVPEADVALTTFGDYAKYQALYTTKQFLALQAFCQSNKLALTKEMKNEIDTQIKELIKSDFNNSKFEFNATLSRFSINETIYRQIKELNGYYPIAEEYLFGSGGKHTVTDSEIRDYYNNNYVRVEHILISTMPTEYDEEGYEIPLSEEELESIGNKAGELYEKIKSGEIDFKTAQSEHTEDPGIETYPYGYTFNKYESFYQEFKDAAFDMSAGEYRLIETTAGWHIMRKEELLEDISEFQEEIISEVKYDIFDQELKAYIDGIKLNEDEYNAIDVVGADVMFDCPSLVY